MSASDADTDNMLQRITALNSLLLETQKICVRQEELLAEKDELIGDMLQALRVAKDHIMLADFDRNAVQVLLQDTIRDAVAKG
jgi:hypothetical protein